MVRTSRSSGPRWRRRTARRSRRTTSGTGNPLRTWSGSRSTRGQQAPSHRRKRRNPAVPEPGTTRGGGIVPPPPRFARYRCLQLLDTLRPFGLGGEFVRRLDARGRGDAGTAQELVDLGGGRGGGRRS